MSLFSVLQCPQKRDWSEGALLTAITSATGFLPRSRAPWSLSPSRASCTLLTPDGDEFVFVACVARGGAMVQG